MVYLIGNKAVWVIDLRSSLFAGVAVNLFIHKNWALYKNQNLDCDMRTGILGRVHRDLGLGVARWGTSGREAWNTGTQNTGQGDAKRIISVSEKVGSECKSVTFFVKMSDFLPFLLATVRCWSLGFQYSGGKTRTTVSLLYLAQSVSLSYLSPTLTNLRIVFYSVIGTAYKKLTETATCHSSYLLAEWVTLKRAFRPQPHVLYDQSFRLTCKIVTTEIKPNECSAKGKWEAKRKAKDATGKVSNVQKAVVFCLSFYLVLCKSK